MDGDTTATEQTSAVGTPQTSVGAEVRDKPGDFTAGPCDRGAHMCAEEALPVLALDGAEVGRMEVEKRRRSESRRENERAKKSW